MGASTPIRRVVLLKGVNVGGRHKLPMAELREMCTALGCLNVSTYIQSGNVVLDSELDADELGRQLEAAFSDRVGFTPRIVTRQANDLVRVLANNPFPDANDRFLHIGFMSGKPTASAVAALADVDCAPEGFEIVGEDIYLHYADGVSQSKRLAKVPFERKLGVEITARNLRTVRKLVELSAA